jgi:putative holliday junction resolvase
VILGVDPGSRRTGVAVADLETRWARPLEVIDGEEQDPIHRIKELVVDLGTTLVVVGRPVGLSGRSGPAVDRQQQFVARLREAISVAVEEFDERLTTVAAERRLIEGGATATKRKEIRDAVAAQLMLQDFLDSRS